MTRKRRGCVPILPMRSTAVALYISNSAGCDDAIVDYDAALRIDAKTFASLDGRGMAKRRKHDIAGDDADIAAARALKPEISMDFARYGVSPPLPDMQSRSRDAVTASGRRQSLLSRHHGKFRAAAVPADVISSA